MSSTTSYPTIDPSKERKALLKSSRKLEAVLGATPIVLELPAPPSSSSSDSSDDYPRPPNTPRTKARRRHAQVLGTSSASSSDDDDEAHLLPSSSDSDYEEADGSFIIVAPSASIPADAQSQGRKRSKSEAAPSKKSKASKTQKPLPKAPVHILDLTLDGEALDAKAGARERKKSTAKASSTSISASPRSNSSSPRPTTSAGVKPVAQPVIFRMRASPAPTSPTRPTQQGATGLRRASTVSVASTSEKTERGHAKSLSDDITSPTASVFNRYVLPSTFSIIDHKNLTRDAFRRLSLLPPDAREAREREMKRRKMAKVVRTLGERVPVELVFGPEGARLFQQEQDKENTIAIPEPTTAKPSRTDSTTRRPARKVLTHRGRSMSVPNADPYPIVDTQTAPPLPVSSAKPLEINVTPSTPTPTSTTHNTPTPKTTPSSPTRTRLFSKPTPVRTALKIGMQVEVRDEKSLESPRGRVAFEGLVNPPPTSPTSPTVGRSRSAVRAEPRLALGVPVPSRGASSLDIERLGGGMRRMEGETDEEWGRRKEREWSGEWNLKDMEAVRGRLRGLKLK